MSFILSGIAAIFTAFSYCELSTMYPNAGAEYIYVREAFPQWPYLSFIVGMNLIFAGVAVVSTVALAFGGYMQQFLPIGELRLALILMLLCTLINYFGIKSSNLVNILFTVIEIVGVLIVIWVGYTVDTPAALPEISLQKGTLVGSSLIFFIYLGFEDIVNLSEEAHNPYKSIPRAILISLAFTTILYLLVSFAVIRLIRPEGLISSHSPLADAVSARAPSMNKMLSSIALFSTANTVLITMLVLSRMMFSMSKGGDLPGILGQTHQKYLVPHWASFVVFFLSCGLLYFKDLETLVSFSSFTTILAFISVNLSLIILRYRRPEMNRPFLVPFNIGRFPILSGLGVVIGVLMCLQFKGLIYFVSGMVILVCTLYYWVREHYS